MTTGLRMQMCFQYPRRERRYREVSDRATERVLHFRELRVEIKQNWAFRTNVGTELWERSGPNLHGASRGVFAFHPLHLVLDAPRTLIMNCRGELFGRS